MPTESDRFVPRSGARADAAGLCAGCAYAADFLAHGQCQPGDICIRAHSGRQIDRFLRRNPQEASKFLDDLFWERRAIAARHAPAEEVYRLRDDVDEVVRRVVVTRLPEALLVTMLSDPDREVRLSVATRLPAELLPPDWPWREIRGELRDVYAALAEPSENWLTQAGLPPQSDPAAFAARFGGTGQSSI